MSKRLRFIGLTLGLIISTTTWACSSFEFGSAGNGGLAHNFDWQDGYSSTTAFYINARNTTKAGLNFQNSDAVAHWTSKYGSVTYSMVGREFPIGGQNEMGLLVHAQQNEAAQYPTGSLPVLDGLQWIQYLLDTSATVTEAIANAKLVRPWLTVEVHYIVCDATTACAVVEFEKGKMLVYQGSTLPAKAMTNNEYPTSLKAWKSCQTSSSDCKSSDNSLQRFMEAAALSANSNSSTDPLDYSLSGLQQISQAGDGESTRYHFFHPAVKIGIVYFSGGTQKQWQTFDMSKLDYSCAGAGQYFEIDTKASGDQSSAFLPYDLAEQTKLVQQSAYDSDVKATMINYPATTICKDSDIGD